MYSNLEMQPIQYCSGRNKSDEGLAEFLVASADAPTKFDPSEEAFDHVAMGVGEFGIVILYQICLTRRNAGGSRRS